MTGILDSLVYLPKTSSLPASSRCPTEHGVAFAKRMALYHNAMGSTAACSLDGTKRGEPTVHAEQAWCETCLLRCSCVLTLPRCRPLQHQVYPSRVGRSLQYILHGLWSLQSNSVAYINNSAYQAKGRSRL